MKRIVRVLFVFALAWIVWQTLMIASTYSVVQFAKTVFLQQIDKNAYPDNCLVNKYYYPKDITHSDITIRIYPLFVNHNFEKGVMYVSYTFVVRDRITGELVCGNWGVDSKWTIEKNAGKWIVNRIDEHP